MSQIEIAVSVMSKTSSEDTGKLVGFLGIYHSTLSQFSVMICDQPAELTFLRLETLGF
jgi:hypothetical protein